MGFGKSIVANQAFAAGNYSTAFIPTYYKDGYTGDALHKEDHTLLTIAAHKIKNMHLGHGVANPASKHHSTFFMTIKPLRDSAKVNLKVEQIKENTYKITDLDTGNSRTSSISDFDLDYGSLVTMKVDGKEQILQFNKNEIDGVQYEFSYKGNKVQMLIYDETQAPYSHHMPEPVVLDMAKNVISPMPGTVLEVYVQPGDSVVEGQQLCMIEAMKMQNIIKAEKEGVIKQVNVKGGQAVAVDELLIELK
jgi:propionyl-CoA carboxylase alpha chain